MKYKAILFDLDGTLLDTLKGITDAANLTFQQLGYSIKHDYISARHFIGAGALNFIKKAMKNLNVSDEEASIIGRTFLENYDRLQGSATIPFDGIPELLEDLKKVGYLICIVSNKPQILLDHIVAEKFPDFKFDMCLGQRDGIPEKPNPYCIKEVINEFNLSNEDCLYIGDSSYDYETANNANIDCCIVKYGYGFYDQDFVKKSTFAVDFVDDLRKMLLD